MSSCYFLLNLPWQAAAWNVESIPHDFSFGEIGYVRDARAAELVRVRAPTTSTCIDNRPTSGLIGSE